MTHVVSEAVLKPPFDRFTELVSTISSPEQIRARKNPRIMLLLNGRYSVLSSHFKPQIFQSNSMMLIPAGCSLRMEKTDSRIDTRSHLCNLSFRMEKAVSDDPFVRLIHQHSLAFQLRSITQPHLIRNLIAEIRGETEEVQLGADLKLDALVRTLVIEVFRQMNSITIKPKDFPASRSYIANQAKDYIAKNHRQPIRLSDLAWHLNLSEEHLCRIFKAETGITLFQFLNKYRVECSKGALIQSNRSIAKIAELTGFSSSTLFSRQFKLQTGISPVEYRLTRGGRFGTVHKAESRM